MLNHLNPDAFFENCLQQCALLTTEGQTRPTLSQLKADEKLRASLVRTLTDIKIGSDTIFARGKPSDIIADFNEWERRWSAWASSRTAAFHSRAALLMLGDKSHFDYFLNVLRTSHNLAFLSASSDVLQHATSHYLSGPAEELNKAHLADYWQRRGF